MSDKSFDYISRCAQIYRADLVENILKFWLKNGLDEKNGGFHTCLNRDGSLMDSTKSVWFQGRGAYIFSLAYNSISKNKAWLEASKNAIDFIESYCFSEDNRMYFELEADGKPIRKRRYLFSECFTCIGMSEYAKASADLSYAKKALDLFKRIIYLKNTEGVLESKYDLNYKIKGLSVPAILLNTAMRIREVISDDIIDSVIQSSIDEIKNDFLHPEFKALLEVTSDNGEFIDTNMGRIINPGHCIEAAWFILEEAKYRNWDANLVELATTILDWSWEKGWDKEFEGLFNFVDCKGLPSQDYSQDMKFWWPHTETIIASLYAYQATSDIKYLNMHKQIHDYTYKVFPDKEFGEWYGYLHRDGSVAQPAKGNLFKGPFHIPRMMIIASELCNQIVSVQK